MLNSFLTPFSVVLGLSLPTTRAECTPRSSKAYFERWSYRYLAVSAKAVKTITFLFSPFIGFLILFSINFLSS